MHLKTLMKKNKPTIKTGLWLYDFDYTLQLIHFYTYYLVFKHEHEQVSDFNESLNAFM